MISTIMYQLTSQVKIVAPILVGIAIALAAWVGRGDVDEPSLATGSLVTASLVWLFPAVVALIIGSKSIA